MTFDAALCSHRSGQCLQREHRARDLQFLKILTRCDVTSRRDLQFSKDLLIGATLPSPSPPLALLALDRLIGIVVVLGVRRRDP